MNFKKIKLNNLISIMLFIVIIYFYNNTEILLKLVYYLVAAAIIIGVIYFSFKGNNKSNYSLEIIDNMSGNQFEKYLVNIFKNKGYSVTHVGGSGDYGADLILKKDNEKIIVQAKRYSNSVGVKAVQEVISAKEFYHGTKAIVITNNFFTPNAKTMANKCNVVLVDRNKLLKL